MSKIEIIKSYYEPKLAIDGPDYQKLGWESEDAQMLRFDALVLNVQLNGKSLLDVGCGLGNLQEHLLSKNISVNYTGIDILPQMVECAKAKNLPGEFHCIDVFEKHPFGNDSFDVIYASGMFNLNMGNNREFFGQALCEFSKLAREVIAFNLLDYRSPGREDTYYYFAPAEVVEIIESLHCRPKKVQIIEQYLNNDFTVICEK